jgi:hypothetical protein
LCLLDGDQLSQRGHAPYANARSPGRAYNGTASRRR